MPVTSSLIASTALVAATITVPVISTKPIVQNQPVMVKEYRCTESHRPSYDRDGALVGGIVGGIIGSTMGHDNNSRRILTGVGAVIGSQVGGQGPSAPISHCGESYTQRAVPTIVGYNVTYVVDGIQQSTVLSYDPGSHVTVQRSYSVR